MIRRLCLSLPSRLREGLGVGESTRDFTCPPRHRVKRPPDVSGHAGGMSDPMPPFPQAGAGE